MGAGIARRFVEAGASIVIGDINMRAAQERPLRGCALPATSARSSSTSQGGNPFRHSPMRR
jgi:hypothetical protein